MKNLFAITDIETTGTHASANGITEIAIVLTDGTKEIDRYQTLLRPEFSIPYHITQLTGISNEMVADAPLFEDIAEELFSWFEDSIFVAHNVGFDYAFIKKSFEHYGYRFHPPRLCTVRLSRKLIPGLSSYSLGRICEQLGIDNHARHRALGDTLATVELFHRLVAVDKDGVIDAQLKRGQNVQWLPPGLPEAQFHHLPERPGVYYLHDRTGKPLYIGMSANIKKRIRQHFGGKMDSKRRQVFLSEVTSISFELTGTTTIARLLEDAEIRKHWPPYNMAQKRPGKRFTLVSYADRAGYKRLAIQPWRAGLPQEVLFYGLAEARDAVMRWCRENELHPELCGLHRISAPLPDVQEHNQKIDLLLDSLSAQKGRMIIPGQGRKESERSFIWVEDGTLRGYGFVDRDMDVGIDRAELLEQYLHRLPTSEMTRSILAEVVHKEA